MWSFHSRYCIFHLSTFPFVLFIASVSLLIKFRSSSKFMSIFIIFIISIMKSLSANSIMPVIFAFVSIDEFSSWWWITFSWLSTCLVLFDRMLVTVNVMLFKYWILLSSFKEGWSLFWQEVEFLAYQVDPFMALFLFKEIVLFKTFYWS